MSVLKSIDKFINTFLRKDTDLRKLFLVTKNSLQSLIREYKPNSISSHELLIRGDLQTMRNQAIARELNKIYDSISKIKSSDLSSINFNF